MLIYLWWMRQVNRALSGNRNFAWRRNEKQIWMNCHFQIITAKHTWKWRCLIPGNCSNPSLDSLFTFLPDLLPKPRLHPTFSFPRPTLLTHVPPIAAKTQLQPNAQSANSTEKLNSISIGMNLLCIPFNNSCSNNQGTRNAKSTAPRIIIPKRPQAMTSSLL